MGRNFEEKDPFAALDQDFKDAIAGMDEGEIRDRIAKISLDDAALKEAKSNDEDLKQVQSIAREAGAVYREGAKMNSLRIKFARRVLGDKAKYNGESGL
jgi:hypothetical protein